MFYYYGAKNQLAKHYPAPSWGTIIEPFAGSAGYSQFWRKTIRQAILIEKDERVVELWHQLLRMTPEAILALPTPEVGAYYDQPMDMLIKMAAASNGVSAMAGPLACPKRVVGVWPGMLRRMAARVDDLRNWVVIHGDYTDSIDYVQRHYPVGSRFTWFIDPPYQPRATTSKAWTPLGAGYRGAGLDYAALGAWVDELPGQVIVCEQEGADWHPGFRPLRVNQDSQGRFSQEVIATWERCGSACPRKFSEPCSPSSEDIFGSCYLPA